MNGQPGTMTLEIVTTAEPEADGQKGFFSSSVAENRHSVQTFSVAELANRIEAAVRGIGEAISRAALSTASVRVEKAEVSLEITAKGEVRLIASGSLETKGAIKLTVVPKQ